MTTAVPQRFSFRLLLQPKFLAILVLGFSSGVPLALSASTLFVWMRETGVDLTTIGIFAALGAPYTLKFLWSPFVDEFRLPFLTKLLGRRRSWIVFSQFLLIISIIGLGFSAPDINPLVTAIMALLVAFFSATQDIVIDAFRIEKLKKDEQAVGAASYVYGYRIGMLGSGAGALYIATFYSWSVTYMAMAGLILVGTLAALISKEPDPQFDEKIDRPLRQKPVRVVKKKWHDPAGIVAGAVIWALLIYNFSWSVNYIAMVALAFTGTVAILYTKLAKVSWEEGKGQSRSFSDLIEKAVVNPFGDFIKRRGWVAILLFIVLFKLGDALVGTMTNPFLIDLEFTKIEIANISKLFGFWATMGGLALGGFILAKVSLFRALIISFIVQIGSTTMFVIQAHVGHNLELLAGTIAAENLASGMGTAVFVAYLSVLCNIKYTATQYALFSSLFAISRTFLSTGSGALAEQFGWASFFILTMVAAIPGIILLFIIKRFDGFETDRQVFS